MILKCGFSLFLVLSVVVAAKQQSSRKPRFLLKLGALAALNSVSQNQGGNSGGLIPGGKDKNMPTLSNITRSISELRGRINGITALLPDTFKSKPIKKY